MTLVRWNPTREFTNWPSSFFGLRRDLVKLLDDIARGDVQDDGTYALSSWTPVVDIMEYENDFRVHVELPGVKKEDVRIALESNVLTIRGEKKQEEQEKKSGNHRTECVYGSFQRSFTLPSTVKSDRIDAIYRDGILTITLPKAEEAKSRQIEVKVK
jgi:HSP20 family protein